MRKIFCRPFAAALLIWLFSPALSAQEPPEYQVLTVTFQDTLMPTDEFEPDFGRFDAFELQVSRGDRLLIAARARTFSPTIVLIAPDEQSFVASPEGQSREVFYTTTVPIDGTYLLIIRGDSAALGPYRVDCWWAKANSLAPASPGDLCDELNFLAAHANADFFFLKRPPLPGTDPNRRQPSFTLTGALYARIEDPGRERYVARMYQGKDFDRADRLFNSLSGKVRFCAGATWKEEFRPWHTVAGLYRYRRTFMQMVEEDREDYRFVRVAFSDYRLAPQVSPYPYVVEIVVGRHHP